MSRIVLVLAAWVAVAATPVSAQVYFEPGPYGRYEEYEYRPAPPRSRARQPRYEDEYREYRPRRSYRQSRAGSICVTARGSCDAGGGFPLNTPCSCYIPGFGAKRGAVGY